MFVQTFLGVVPCKLCYRSDIDALVISPHDPVHDRILCQLLQQQVSPLCPTLLIPIDIIRLLSDSGRHSHFVYLAQPNPLMVHFVASWLNSGGKRRCDANLVVYERVRRPCGLFKRRYHLSDRLHKLFFFRLYGGLELVRLQVAQMRFDPVARTGLPVELIRRVAEFRLNLHLAALLEVNDFLLDIVLRRFYRMPEAGRFALMVVGYLSAKALNLNRLTLYRPSLARLALQPRGSHGKLDPIFQDSAYRPLVRRFINFFPCRHKL